MIDGVDQRLEQWASSVLATEGGPIEVRSSPPVDAAATPCVALHLLDLLPAPATASAARNPPLQITLRYLVTTCAASAAQAHRMLGTLVFAAMEHPELEVELEPLPAGFWEAFGVAPRPSFLLRVPLRRERPEPKVERVRRPAEVRFAALTTLRGRVVGPGDVPLAAAQVELPSLGVTTRTDSDGCFRFAALPAEPVQRQIRVRARGQEMAVTVEPTAAPGQSVVIRFDIP